MIIFTEHNEVVMSQDDLRLLAEHMFSRGWEAHRDGSQYPPTLVAAGVVKGLMNGLKSGKPLDPDPGVRDANS